MAQFELALLTVFLGTFIFGSEKDNHLDWSHEAQLLAQFQQQLKQYEKQQNSFFTFKKFVSIFSNNSFNRRKR